MDWKLELVVVPVTDVDRAKQFYAEQLGFDRRRRFEPERAVPRRAADPAGLGVLDQYRQGAHRGGARIARRACRSRSATSTPRYAQLVERGVDVSPIRHVGESGLGRRQGRRLQLVHLLQGPGRQRLGDPGEPAAARRSPDRRGPIPSAGESRRPPAQAADRGADLVGGLRDPGPARGRVRARRGGARSPRTTGSMPSAGCISCSSSTARSSRMLRSWSASSMSTDRPLRTGYVEAVATAPEHQGVGLRHDGDARRGRLRREPLRARRARYRRRQASTSGSAGRSWTGPIERPDCRRRSPDAR